MANSEIKIFYSWQSDLPGGKTRYLIQDSIDAVVNEMKDTIEIIADRDKKGEFGSPDIVQTIFSKIEEMSEKLLNYAIHEQSCIV